MDRALRALIALGGVGAGLDPLQAVRATTSQ
jgi:hypothetical protein